MEMDRRTFLQLGAMSLLELYSSNLRSESSKELLTLEQVVKDLPLLQNQDLVNAYRSRNKNFKAAYKDIVSKIYQCDFMQYTQKHALDSVSWCLDPMLKLTNDCSNGSAVTFGKDRKVNFYYRTTSNQTVINVNDNLEAVAFFRNNRLYSQALADFLGLKLGNFLLQQCQSFNQEWKEKPWRKLVNEDYKQNWRWSPEVYPYNPKSNEFVFFGTLSCKPCEVVVKYLLKNKIKFTEKFADSGPYAYYQDQRGNGLPEVIEIINKMYGISPK